MGLRAEKKSRTSRAITDAALRLLEDRRFADVTVEEIAAAAGVSTRTFFRYFPTKEDLFLDPRRIDRAYAAEALAARAPGEDDVTLVMRVLAELQRRRSLQIRPEDQLALHRVTHTEPELTARTWLLLEEVRSIIVRGLVGPDAGRAELFRARVLTGACILVVDAAITTWIEGGVQDDLDAILDEGAQHLRRGFGGAS